MREMIYQYDGSFAGFLCCVFESYRWKELPTAFSSLEDTRISLFPSRAVETEEAHAKRVFRKVRACSPYGANLVAKGYLTCLPERERYLYALIRKLLSEGPGFLRNFSDDTLFPVITAVRHLNGEAHLLKGFVRFSELGGVLVSEIAPKNRVLPLLRAHFRARCEGETFFIYDRTHREGLFGSGGKTAIVPLEDFQMAAPDEAEASYRALWKRFYHTIAIQERENPRLRMTHMPKRYWATMTEFQPELTQTPPADAPPPAFPAGTPAPGIPPGSGPSVPG